MPGMAWFYGEKYREILKIALFILIDKETVTFLPKIAYN